MQKRLQNSTNISRVRRSMELNATVQTYWLHEDVKWMGRRIAGDALVC
jgi:hypothetical protein